jgi:hypothetical protein
MKVALTQRISKPEKKAASQVRTGSLEAQPLYQPSEADLAEALAILVKCGVVRAVTTPLVGQSYR